MARKDKSNFKPLIRVAAFDDGYFIPKTKSKVVLVGVVSRLDGRIEGILSTYVGIDELDATKKLISLINKSRFKLQIQAILLSGINVAGFNMLDIKEINQKLQIPVIAISRKKPNIEKFKVALKKLPNSKLRLKMLKNAGPIKKYLRIFYQCAGCTENFAEQIIKMTIKYSTIPEPLRLAHIIASGVSSGESKR